jgi:hypothetical protein
LDVLFVLKAFRHTRWFHGSVKHIFLNAVINSLVSYSTS